jgi:hypothetical protein
VFSENLAVAHMVKTKVKLNKPIYLGMSILDLSKTFMYDFFYGYVKPTCGDRASLLMTDTDSLILEIKTDDVYTEIRNRGHHMEYFDFSNYSEDHPSNLQHGSKKNKKGPPWLPNTRSVIEAI